MPINRVYIKLNGQETVTIHNVQHGNSIRNETETCNTFQQEITIANAQTLKANQRYEWETMVEFPKNIPPAYHGRNATHELRILAGLDTPGNDPDSGWTVLPV